MAALAAAVARNSGSPGSARAAARPSRGRIAVGNTPVLPTGVMYDLILHRPRSALVVEGGGRTSGADRGTAPTGRPRRSIGERE